MQYDSSTEKEIWYQIDYRVIKDIKTEKTIENYILQFIKLARKDKVLGAPFC